MLPYRSVILTLPYGKKRNYYASIRSYHPISGHDVSIKKDNKICYFFKESLNSLS